MENYRKFLNESTPCDGCIHANNCGDNNLACLAFALFVDKGVDDWTLPRKPTKKIYARTMGPFDISLRHEIAEQLKSLNGELV